MNLRLQIFSLIILSAFAGIVFRLFYWQIVKSPELKAIARSQYQRIRQDTLSRGKILDADGYPLALNEVAFTLFARPSKMNIKPEQVVSILAPILFTRETLASESAQMLTKLRGTDKPWVSLKTKVSQNFHDQIEDLQIAGIGFDPEEIRFYPEASMAAHLLGFVGGDDQGTSKGFFGLEGKYDLELKGKRGFYSQETDAVGKPIVIGNYTEVSSIKSRDLTLGVKRDLQQILEEKINWGKEKYQAISVDAIIMEPKTGMIIAMAATPGYDPRTFWQFDPKFYRNPTVSDAYEPGSTFKVLTMAMGIDSGAIGPLTTCDDCGAPKIVGKYTIRTWDNKYYPGITMTDALSKSDNTAMMFAASRIGVDRFVSYLDAFGFGKKTNIDLQDESVPMLRENRRWGDIDLATASFGQGIAVTPIQLLTAVNAIANEGKLMKPYVVSKVTSGDEEFMTKPSQVRQVISPKTAQAVTEMMIESASHGDARWTLPEGFEIAGKTGTAQIPVDGHYDTKRTIASFIGFAPAHNPRFTMLVRLTQPQTSQWGSETAAPLWFAIAKELFYSLGLSENISSKTTNSDGMIGLVSP